jgi:hypothetical protein
MFFYGSGGDEGSVVKNAAILNSVKADSTIYANASQPQKAFMRDDSASETVLQATNFHTFGIDLSNEEFSSSIAMAFPLTSCITCRERSLGRLGL